MKNFICFTLALILLAGSIVLMYPELIFSIADEETANKVTGTIKGLMTDEGEEEISDEALRDTLGLKNFPLYGNDENYGLHNFCEEFVPYLNEETETLPDYGAALKKLVSGEKLLETLYYFAIIALLSIPVYMLLRIVPFNALYNAADSSFVLARPFARGLAACACSVVSISVTWFLYHTLMYERLYKAVIDWIGSISKPEIAMNLTNIVLIIVAVAVVIGLLKSTLFRGSIIKSILLAVLRTLLFVFVFAAFNAFIGCATLRTLVFALIVLLVVGLLDNVIDPGKNAK